MPSVEVLDYQPTWPQQYADEARQIGAAIGQYVLRMEHIGSTAVPGLAAKAVIDILILIHDLKDTPYIVPSLAALGYDYVPKHESLFPQRRYFQKLNAEGKHTHHVHIVASQDGFFADHIRFRDLLRADSSHRVAYAQLKHELAAKFPDDRAAYTEGKADWIAHLLKSASSACSYDPPATIGDLNRLQMQMAAQMAANFRQLEALNNLHSVLKLRAPLPPMRGWKISPDFGVLLMDTILRYGVRQVLELGGGVSTIISAYTLSPFGKEAQVIGLEHHAAFATSAQENLRLHGFVDACARIIHAPLQVQPIGEESWQWYTPSALDAMASIDLLVIDGPPQLGNPLSFARYPALPLLKDKLHPGSLILLDDTERHDEAIIVERYLSEFPVQRLPTPETEKGAALLRWDG